MRLLGTELGNAYRIKGRVTWRRPGAYITKKADK